MNIDRYTVGVHTESGPALKDLLDAVGELQHMPKLTIPKLIVDDMAVAINSNDPWLAGFDVFHIVENKLLVNMGLEPGLYSVKGSENYYLITTKPEVPK